MSRIDITRLRKNRGMSQNELSRRLNMTQSFLSAIENGKSPLPPEKESMLLEIFEIPNFDEYLIETGESSGNKKMDELTDSDLFNQLLHRFHRQAHSKEVSHHHHQSHHDRISQLEEYLESLMQRNDKLMQRNEVLAEDNDRLRDEIENLRNEIYRLKSLLVSNGISVQ